MQAFIDALLTSAVRVFIKENKLKNGNFFWNETYEKQQWYPDEKHQWYPVLQPPFPKNRSKKIKFISKRN